MTLSEALAMKRRVLGMVNDLHDDEERTRNSSVCNTSDVTVSDKVAGR